MHQICSLISPILILVFGLTSRHLPINSLISLLRLKSGGYAYSHIFILSTMFFVLFPLKGNPPVTNANKIQPIDQTSRAGDTRFGLDFLSKVSGARYLRVPAWMLSTGMLLRMPAIPKSTTKNELKNKLKLSIFFSPPSFFLLPFKLPISSFPPYFFLLLLPSFFSSSSPLLLLLFPLFSSYLLPSLLPNTFNCFASRIS